MNVSDQKMNLILPSITLLNRLPKSTKSTPNGCGLIHGKTMFPKVRIRQFNYYSKKHIDAAFAKYKTDNDLTEWYTPEEIEKSMG